MDEKNITSYGSGANNTEEQKSQEKPKLVKIPVEEALFEFDGFEFEEVKRSGNGAASSTSAESKDAQASKLEESLKKDADSTSALILSGLGGRENIADIAKETVVFVVYRSVYLADTVAILKQSAVVFAAGYNTLAFAVGSNLTDGGCHDLYCGFDSLFAFVAFVKAPSHVVAHHSNAVFCGNVDMLLYTLNLCFGVGNKEVCAGGVYGSFKPFFSYVFEYMLSKFRVEIVKHALEACCADRCRVVNSAFPRKCAGIQ